MRPYIFVITALFMIVGALSETSGAVTESALKVVHIGHFDQNKSRKLNRICQTQDIKGVQFEPKYHSGCSAKIRIKQVHISYVGGFRQEFSYPNVDGSTGAPMGRQTVSLIPGTRCIENLSIEWEGHECATPISVNLLL